jgi:cytochrome P450
MLASHPENGDYVRQEIADQAGSFYLPYLRATVLESLRLWPTTPLVLRESTGPTEWESGEMPTGTAIVIFAPFFRRDDQRLPFANQFAPQLWLDGNGPQSWPLILFSAGPAACPGRELVLLLSTTILSALIVDSQWELKRATRVESGKPLRER